MTKTILGIEVVDAEKRRVPSKHYVYVIVVKWSDNSSMVVYRRYSRFFDLQTQLLDKFPIEAGATDPSLRIIPFLPGKIFFGRSHIRDVAMKRLGEINAYCKSLLNLPPHISQSDEVLAFFEVESEDLDPPKEDTNERRFSLSLLSGKQKEKKAEKISGPKQLEQHVAVAPYEVQEKGEMELHAGMVVEVTEKSESGWWFVNAEDQKGWVPSTYLEPVSGSKPSQTPCAQEGEEETYICIETFTAENDDELSLGKGVMVEVLQKNMDGWWTVKYQGQEGFAPATYLKKSSDPWAKSLVEKSQQSGVKIITNLSDISNIMTSSASPRNSAHITGNGAADRSSSVQAPGGVTAGKQGEANGSGDEWEDSELEKVPKEEPRNDAYIQVMRKQLSLERSGSLRPPPRQNSIPKMVVDPKPAPTRHSAFVTVADFMDTVGDGISFSTGESVKVLEKTGSGWWFVEIGEKQGWVPESYLEPCSAFGIQSSSAPGMKAVEENKVVSDEDEFSDEDSDDQSQRQPPSSALANALNSRLKGSSGEDNKFAKPTPPKHAIKPTSKPPPPPTKVKDECQEDDVSQNEPASGLASALKSRFESKPHASKRGLPDLPSKPGSKPTPPGLQHKPSDKPTPPCLSSKPSDKPVPPALSHKPSDKPAPPSLLHKPSDKPTPPSLPGKPFDKSMPPGLPSKPSDKPTPPGLRSKPFNKPAPPASKPSVAKSSDETDSNGGSGFGEVSGLASALRAKFETQQQDSKPGKPSVPHSKPSPPSKPSGGSGEPQNKPALPHKLPGSAGSKPLAFEKPAPPSHHNPASAGKPQFPPHKSQAGPPKLPSKPQASSKPASDSNNKDRGTDGGVTPGKVHNMAAMLGKMGAGSSGAESSRLSLPVKKLTPPQPPAVKPSGRSSSGTVHDSKPRVGNLVSELGSKLNFGGGGGGGGGGVGGALKSQEQSSGSKPSPWSAQQGRSPEHSPVAKSAPWSAPQQKFSAPEAPAAKTGGVEYEAVADFAADGKGELSFRCGDIVEVLDRGQEDWWLVRLNGEEGWAPSTYLEPAAEWDD